MKSTNVLLFFAGALVGAAAALLYAPEKGTETRRILKEKIKEAQDGLSELELNDIVDKVLKRKKTTSIED